jgi:hypothetical protein
MNRKAIARKASGEMTASSEVDDGDLCPIDGCDGKMHFPPSKDCTCFLNPPCGSCLAVVLTCNECGWEREDNEVAYAEAPELPRTH